MSTARTTPPFATQTLVQGAGSDAATIQLG
jgi:hypothetical protein